MSTLPLVLLASSTLHLQYFRSLFCLNRERDPSGQARARRVHWNLAMESTEC